MSPTRSRSLGIVALCAVMTLLGCANQDDAADSETTTSGDDPTSAAVSSATTATTATTTTAPSSTKTPETTTTTLAATTTAVPRGLVVYMPFDGETLTECAFAPIGVVRPEGTVTYLGEAMIPDGRFGPPYPLNEGWHRWVGAPEEPYPLNEGANTLEFIATFDDKSTTSTTITVTCDPSLRAVPGFISTMTTDDGLTYQIAFEAGALDEQPDGWSIVDTEPTAFEINDDAVFVIYDRTGRVLYSPEGFAALLAEHDDGMCDLCDGTRAMNTEDCPDRCFALCWGDGDCEPIYGGVAFGLLIDTANNVQQAQQLDPTVGTCCP